MEMCAVQFQLLAHHAAHHPSPSSYSGSDEQADGCAGSYKSKFPSCLPGLLITNTCSNKYIQVHDVKRKIPGELA